MFLGVKMGSLMTRNARILQIYSNHEMQIKINYPIYM